MVRDTDVQKMPNTFRHKNGDKHKDKFVLLHAMNAYRGNRSIAPPILKFGNGWI